MMSDLLKTIFCVLEKIKQILIRRKPEKPACAYPKDRLPYSNLIVKTIFPVQGVQEKKNL